MTKEEVAFRIETGAFMEVKRPCGRLLKRSLRVHGKLHPQTAELQHLFGRILLGLNEPKEAMSHLQQAMAGYEKAGGPGDVARSGCLLDLFRAKQAVQPPVEGAWASLTQACNIRKDLVAPGDPAIAEILALASVQYADELDEGNERPAATRAIMTAQHMYGSGYLACLAIEGMIDVYRENLQKAARSAADGVLSADATGNVKIWLAEWLVVQYANLFGPHNQRLLEPLAKLAELYEARDRIEDAVAILEREKAVNEHVDNFTSRQNGEYLESLARLYERGQDWPKLIGVLKKQLAIVEQDDENDISYAVAKLADGLGAAHLKSGDYRGAFFWHKRAAAYSPDDENDFEDAVTYRVHFGNTYEAYANDGHPASRRTALRIYRNALKLARNWFGPNASLVAEILSIMGNLFARMEEYDEAAKCHKQAVKIWRAVAGDDSAAAKSLNDLAVVYFCTGKYRQARRLLRKALPLVEEFWGVAHANIVPVLSHAAVACAGCAEYSRAIEYLERAVQIVENSAGAWSETLTIYLANLGKVCVMAKKGRDAKLAFERAIVIAREKLGPDNPQTKSLQNSLDDVDIGKVGVSADDLWYMTPCPV